MRQPTDRLKHDVARLFPRSDSGSDADGHFVPDYHDSGIAVRCSVQPIGDTGRRMAREDENLRLSSLTSLRVFIAQEQADEAGLTHPFVREGDRVVFNDLAYVSRGEPLPHRRDRGAIASWMFDMDRES